MNTLASSGSAISLPVLLLFGMSPLDANATNRLTVLFGSLMALYTFQAKKTVEWRPGLKMAIPATKHWLGKGNSSADARTAGAALA